MNTVDRVMRILEVLVEKEEPQSAGDLSNLSKVSIATTYRICSSLTHRGYLKKQKSDGKYMLSMKLLQFSAAIQRSLTISSIATSHMEKLSRVSGEHSSLGVLDNGDVVVAAQVDVPYSLKISNQIGQRLPLHATCMGKVLLAYMKEEEIKEFYKSKKLKKFTDKTMVDLNTLKRELEEIRLNSYATNDEEYSEGIWSIAAPVFGPGKKTMAALALVIPSVRVRDRNKSDLIEMVKQTAQEISREAGG